MSEETVSLYVDGPVAAITIDRPAARNAMTFAMYDALKQALSIVASERTLRVLLLRGGEKAFIAGTDISEFTAFSSGEDGLAYEAKIETVVRSLETLSIPTIAAMKGPAMGGGLVLAAVCDFRILTPTVRIGVPIARTVANCLSTHNLARIERVVGTALARRLLLLAELATAEECRDVGFATAMVNEGEFEPTIARYVQAIVSAAPLTLAASKTAFHRLASANYEDADLIQSVYHSNDFSEGVAAFLGKRAPNWTGT